MTELLNKKGVTKTKKVTFDNNELARSLYGERNSNLRLIEKRLNIILNIRGNDIIVQGDIPELETAENLLTQLYGLLKEGYPIYERDVDYSVRIRILNDNHKAELKPIFLDRIYIPSKKKTITPKSLNQKIYIDGIRKYDIVFGIGPAGTGKTYLAMAMAISSLMKKEVNRIVLARPAVEAGEKLGFLPGDLYEKVNPYLRPLYDALHDMMDFESASRLIQNSVIEVAPLAFMRGRTLNDSFIILDEAQNVTPEQMKMFLTRLGFSSKTVITGDITQTDLPEGKASGLIQARDILADIKKIKFVYFGREDVVRHPLVQEIIDAYDKLDT
ncbi:MAG: PhoH family protein [Deltaproteobacteria bacterium]|nr:PhoH family protein [Deltaproteobacteria bacterium]